MPLVKTFEIFDSKVEIQIRTFSDNLKNTIFFDQLIIKCSIIVFIQHTQQSIDLSRLNNTSFEIFMNFIEKKYLYSLALMQKKSNYITLLMIFSITSYHPLEYRQISQKIKTFLLEVGKNHLYQQFISQSLCAIFMSYFLKSINRLPTFCWHLFLSYSLSKYFYQIVKMRRKNVRIHRKKNHSNYHCQTEHLSSFSMTEEQPFIDKTKQYLADLEQQQKTRIIKPSQTFSFDMSIQQWQSTIDPSTQVIVQNTRWRESTNLLPVRGQQNLISKSFCSEKKASDQGSNSQQRHKKKEFSLTKNKINRYRNGQQIQTSIKFDKKPIQPVLFAMQTPSKPIRLNFGPATNIRQKPFRIVTQSQSPKQQQNEKDQFFSNTNRFILRNRAITEKGFQLFRSNPQRHLINFSISQRKFQ